MREKLDLKNTRKHANLASIFEIKVIDCYR